MVNPNTAAHQQDFATPNAKAAVEVKAADLPVHCPVEGSSLWNSHPQVYIPLDGCKEARCPYCGTLFKLIS